MQFSRTSIPLLSFLLFFFSLLRKISFEHSTNRWSEIMSKSRTSGVIEETRRVDLHFSETIALSRVFPFQSIPVRSWMPLSLPLSRKDRRETSKEKHRRKIDGSTDNRSPRPRVALLFYVSTIAIVFNEHWRTSRPTFPPFPSHLQRPPRSGSLFYLAQRKPWNWDCIFW